MLEQQQLMWLSQMLALMLQQLFQGWNLPPQQIYITKLLRHNKHAINTKTCNTQKLHRIAPKIFKGFHRLIEFNLAWKLFIFGENLISAS